MGHTWLSGHRAFLQVAYASTTRENGKRHLTEQYSHMRKITSGLVEILQMESLSNCYIEIVTLDFKKAQQFRQTFAAKVV